MSGDLFILKNLFFGFLFPRIISQNPFIENPFRKNQIAKGFLFLAMASAAFINGYAVGGAVSSGWVPIWDVRIPSTVILF
jgi:hypothetical protein